MTLYCCLSARACHCWTHAAASKVALMVPQGQRRFPCFVAVVCCALLCWSFQGMPTEGLACIVSRLRWCMCVASQKCDDMGHLRQNCDDMGRFLQTCGDRGQSGVEHGRRLYKRSTHLLDNVQEDLVLLVPQGVLAPPNCSCHLHQSWTLQNRNKRNERLHLLGLVR